MASLSPALLIFDIDGTLFQTHLVTVPAVQRTFADFGLPIPADEKIRSFFGRPVAEYEDWLAEQCPPEQAAQIVEATNQKELALVGETGELYPGVRELLQKLFETGHCLAICSNGPVAYVAEFVRAHGLTPLFRKVLARGTHYESKTVMAAEVRDEFPGLPLVVIGDRQDDIEAAHALGGVAVAAAYGFGAEHELCGAEVVIHAFGELPGALRALLPAHFKGE